MGYEESRHQRSKSKGEEDEVIGLLTEVEDTEEKNFPNTFSLLVWWSITSIIAFSYAGEKMPWLTYHMAWPMILITGWALGRIIDTTNWAKLKEQHILLTISALAIFIVSVMGMVLALNGSTPPFQGKELAQLQATSTFLLPLVATILSAIAVIYLFRKWTFQEIRHVFVLVFFGILAVLTARAAFRASYITYDQATEYLVYAHGATGIKQVMAQAKEISARTTGGMDVAIAYDASAPDTGVSWPFVWYLRDYTRQTSFDQPTRSLRDLVMVIVDEKNFDKIEPALGSDYYRIDYIRMWWPMQDYFSMSYDRDPSQPFPPDYACKGIVGFLKLAKSKDYTPLCEDHYQSGYSRRHSSNLAKSRLHQICRSKRPHRPDTHHLESRGQNAALYPQGCCLANLELWCCANRSGNSTRPNRRKIHFACL